MAVPTLYTHIFKNSTPKVYPLLNGTTLGSQIGAAFGVGESNPPHGLAGAAAPRVANRVIEAFGKVFVGQKEWIYEKDEGGVGNWGSVRFLSWTTGPVSTESRHRGKSAGFFMVHPAGIPTLVFHAELDSGAGQYSFCFYTKDGSYWTYLSDWLVSYTSNNKPGDAITYRDSLFITGYYGPTNNEDIIEFNFLTGIVTRYVLSGGAVEQNNHSTLCVHKNEIYFISNDVANSYIYMRKLVGGVWVKPTGSLCSSGRSIVLASGWTSFSDGSDIVAIMSGAAYSAAVYGDHACRFHPDTGDASTDITDPLVPADFRPGGASGTAGTTWAVVIDNNSNPGMPPTIYLWRHVGPHMDPAGGNRLCYTFQYRKIDYTGLAGGPFTLGELVTESSSGATGRIHTDTGSGLHLADVDGAFVGGQTLTGSDSGATASSVGVLTEQPLIFNGSSISPNYDIPSVRDSVGPYIPTYPASRIELGVMGHRLTHGVVSAPGAWTLGEEITGPPEPATITSTVDLTGTVDLSVNKLCTIQIDSFSAHVDIDLSAGAAVPAAVTRAEIMANLSTALGAEATVSANDSGGQFIDITTASEGGSSQIEFTAPTATDATDVVFGTAFGATGGYPNTFNGYDSPSGTLMIDNLGTIVVVKNNPPTADREPRWRAGDLITGGSSGATAVLSLDDEFNFPVPSHEVIGGRKHYFRVWGTSGGTVTGTLYSDVDEETPRTRETILSVALEYGTPPGTAPSVVGGAITNLSVDNGVRLWSLVHDASSFLPGDTYELSMDAV